MLSYYKPPRQIQPDMDIPHLAIEYAVIMYEKSLNSMKSMRRGILDRKPYDRAWGICVSSLPSAGTPRYPEVRPDHPQG